MNTNELLDSIVKDAQKGYRFAVTEKVEALIKENALIGKHWGALARICILVGAKELAMETAQRYLNVMNSNDAKLSVAGVFAELNEMDKAFELVNSISKRSWGGREYHFAGVCLSQLGELDSAKENFLLALKLQPLSGPTWLSLLALNLDDDTIEKQLLNIEPDILKTEPLNLSQFLFAKAMLLERKNKTSEQIKTLEKANELLNSENSNFVENQKNITTQIISNQDQAFFDLFPTSSATADFDPVFIIGLPRSGTSLLEQILVSNRQYLAGGELNFSQRSLPSIPIQHFNRLESQNVDNEVKINVIDQFHNEFNWLLKQHFGDIKSKVIDKTLDLNKYAGLLSKAFPQSKFVYISRDKQENSWSCYKNFFRTNLPWSYDLTNINAFFDSETKLIQHWLKMMPSRIHCLKYEELINNPESELKSLCKFLNIEYSNEMLNFYKNKTINKTVSFAQVKQPLNNKSLVLNSEIKKFLTN
ncbi:tetratricopeptide repeat-containing sulfotransferase family protein [uncultured Psychrosphaera sp.]|uniref:tetratricopeptide repeat-containing sulfotransferase family protein n=1 Tax=uncultured Psychrosphaera sp. TaxID=1403522 RepID=UPI00260CC70F|nr:tetratricopeptide repeat-containing sulfotransferase family protein [uncultured Psychrosphaera sp.]